ncbi:hypothetical protein MVEN_00655100 [Mycena venus]|uniref:Fungal-type protein kinase domain-containing protein n=1 Tax=Mycena venus TaxID=2733690 RepID=A0A8H6YKT4_9AGAR|nr:hypothetical protein MVEN_00655100 [Mycena venus]
MPDLPLEVKMGGGERSYRFSGGTAAKIGISVKFNFYDHMYRWGRAARPYTTSYNAPLLQSHQPQPPRRVVNGGTVVLGRERARRHAPRAVDVAPATARSADDPPVDTHQDGYRQNKRKHDEVTSKTSVQGMARGFRRLAALFGEICHIIAEAQAYERAPMPDDDIDPFSEETTDEEHAFLAKKRGRAYVVIDRLIPGLAAKVAALELTDKADYFSRLQKGANDARSDDFRRISGSVGDWINEDFDKPEIRVFDHTPSITVTNEETGQLEVIKRRAPRLTSDRSTRGVENDITGGLLTASSTKWNDPVFRAKQRGALIDLGGNYFLRIFYRDFTGDPENLEKGYLQSRYLVKSYKSVFTSPSSAKKHEEENVPPTKKSKTASGPIGKSNAVKLGMDGKVTGRSIAYIAVNLWLSLTTAVAWTDEYYGVSLAQMYDFIVDFFEEPKEGTRARERADELLAWWNKEIFSAHSSSAATNKTTSASRAALMAQRAAMEN